MLAGGLLNRGHEPGSFQYQNARRSHLRRSECHDGRDEVCGRCGYWQPRADLGGVAQFGGFGGDGRHLAGGAGFRSPGRRRTSLRSWQDRKPLGARRHRNVVCPRRWYRRRGLQSSARRRGAADLVGHPICGAADRYRRQSLARPRPAPRRARHQEPGIGSGRAALRIGRAGLRCRHHRSGAVRTRLRLGRRRRRNRYCDRHLAAGTAAGAIDGRNLARPRT